MELRKGHPGALTPPPMLDRPGPQQGSRDALALSARPQSHHLFDRGFLTYSGDNIQVQNIFTTFQSRWNLCKDMYTYYLSECHS